MTISCDESMRGSARSETAGPGLVPFALNTGFGTELSVVDDCAVAGLRDDGDALPPTKRAMTVLKATTGDRRRAAGVCKFITEQLCQTSLWIFICEYYGCEQYKRVDVLFHVVEYVMCELRRLLGRAVKRTPKYEGVAAEWSSMVDVAVANWRRVLLKDGKNM